MNNGQNHQQLGQELSLVNLTGSAVVTPENYRRNRDQLARARAMLDRMEQENESGHAHWVRTVEDLTRRVEDGRQAE